jgi:uncharacterized protein with gpF-like domain
MITRAIMAAASMPVWQARQVIALLCQAEMTTEQNVEQKPTEGQKHYAKRAKIINRVQGAANRILDYARHETLRNCEKHFRQTAAIASAEEIQPSETLEPLAARITFERNRFAEELMAALREEAATALGVAGQQLFDEIGRDNPFKMPAEAALKFLDTRENLLANAPDEIHQEVMQTVQEGLEHGDTKKELMARIETAFSGIKESRASAIANTETAAAFNYARDQAMRQAGITHKKWLHSHSPLIKEPRPTHLEADGLVVPVDEPFNVAGVLFMYPSDSSLGAGPEDIINCHCVAIAVEAPPP